MHKNTLCQQPQLVHLLQNIPFKIRELDIDPITLTTALQSTAPGVGRFDTEPE